MTVLVDTSVWADHFRAGEADLIALLQAGAVRMHAFVVGELALGSLRDRRNVVAMLASLDAVPTVDDEALLAFVETAELAGMGIGFVDAHLLAAARHSGIPLWTRDKRLRAKAEQFGLAWG